MGGAINKKNQYILVIIYLMASFCYGASIKADIEKKEFGFSNLGTKNKHSVMQYGIYDPTKAINYCKEIPPGGIWPEPGPYNPPLPDPKPTASDCEDSIHVGSWFQAQMAYGCNVDQLKPDNSIGAMLSYSVVAIALPYKDGVLGGWETSCSGTIIGDGQWVLTAAHCLTKQGGLFKKRLSHMPIYIVPWQKLGVGMYGVPTKLTMQNSNQIKKVMVEAAYIPNSYNNDLDLGQQDLALLKLREKLPSPYRPINLATVEPVPDSGPLAIWSAGYGNNENQIQDGELHYRKNYYITNAYDRVWPGGKSGNFGELYYLSSMPGLYKGQLSAWSLLGNGDSGGPILSYNRIGKGFELEGVISSALYCDYAGYFAKLPYPYNIANSTAYPANKKLINSIINHTATALDVRCISATGGCKLGYMYVANNSSHTIAAYLVRLDKSLEFISATTYINYLTQMATYKNVRGVRYLLVITLEGEILLYKVNDKEDDVGELINVDSHVSSGSAFVDLKIFDDNVYVVDNFRNQIVIYKISDVTGMLYSMKNLSSGVSPVSITIARTKALKHYALVLNEKPASISIYLVDKNVELNKHIYDIELGTSIGQPIQITSQSVSSDKIYLLTTKGIYVYRILEDVGVPELNLQAKISDRFDIKSAHIKVLDSNSVAVSDSLNNQVNIYKLNNETLERINVIPSSRPIGIEAIHSYNRDFMYITNYDTRQITLFQGQNGFTHLEYSSEYRALDKSTVIHYVGD